jgi:zinc transport system permease protein
VRPADLLVIAALSLAVVGVVVVFGRELYAVCMDEEVARVSGVPVRLLNILVAVTAAVTVTVAMRVVGLLLVSALMVVPVATAQQMTRSFRATLLGACAVGVAASLGGLVLAFYGDVAPGASTVVLALGAFLAAAVLGQVRRRAA